MGRPLSSGDPDGPDPARGPGTGPGFRRHQPVGWAGRWWSWLEARAPAGLPSDRTISPTSMSCLNRRRSSAICWPGSSPRSFATATAAGPPGRVVVKADVDLGAPVAGRRDEPGASGVVDLRPVDGTPGDQTVRTILDDLGVPLDVGPRRPLGLPVRMSVEDPHRVQVVHERRQALEVMPSLVDLRRRPPDGGARRHVRRVPGLGRPAFRLGHGGLLTGGDQSSTVQPTTAPVATPSRVTLRGWKR